MSKQRIFIAGHRGMVGSAIRRQLEQRGDVELVLRTRDELNLLDSRAVHDFFASERIDQVYLAAAKVGGIVANNTYPADFIYQNMMIGEITKRPIIPPIESLLSFMLFRPAS